LVTGYLRSIGANSQEASIYRSQLRPALVKVFPDLNITSSNPFFGQSLKAALDAAVDRGRFGQSCVSPGRERLWLMEARPSEPLADNRGIVNQKEKTETKNTSPTYARTAEFRKRLTDLGIFCEKRERDVLIEALGRILLEAPCTISRLRRELSKKAELIAREHGACDGVDFRRITNFFLKLCLVSKVLKRKDESPIVRNAGAEASEAASLVESPLDVLETYLLEQVLKKSDVKDREHWQLALALFREFDQSISIDDKLDRIATLIDRLGTLVVLTDDGTYDYTENVPVPLNVRAVRA
jgi:hypothetical protein